MLLRNVAGFRDIGPKQLLNLALALRLEQYHSGELVVRQGQKMDKVFFVKTGQVLVSIDGTDFATLRKGFWFGLHSAVKGKRSLFEFKASGAPENEDDEIRSTVSDDEDMNNLMDAPFKKARQLNSLIHE